MTKVTPRKIALIIGNGNYSQSKNKLKYSAKNAQDLSNLLETIDFDVNASYTDIERDDQMNDILRQFVNRVEDGDLILFYFCGHGYQTENHNYLIPIGDNQIENEHDIVDFSINVQHALQLLVEKNKSYVTIFILNCSTPYYFKNQSITDG